MQNEGNNVLCEAEAGGSIGSDASTVCARGCSVVTGGTGIYTVTLDKALDAGECVILVTPRTAASTAASVVHTSTTVKTINMRVIDAVGSHAAVAAAFDFLVLRISGASASR